MQFAIVETEKKEAFQGGRGICPICGTTTIAKCGPRIVHHWAHFRIRDCDPWWENETLWHREWKNNFPAEYREVSHIASDGEIHRADIKTPKGIVIEFQHSAMTDEERISREEFYQNMIWVIDGRGFKNNFDIYHKLPDPNSDIAQDLVWTKAKRHMNGSNEGLFFRLSEMEKDYPGITKETHNRYGGWIHPFREIKGNIEDHYNGYHQFDWVKPRSTWLDATCPVYIDFGDDFLIKLETYDETKLKCIRYISKIKFMYDVMHEEDENNIATKFFKIDL